MDRAQTACGLNQTLGTRPPWERWRPTGRTPGCQNHTPPPQDFPPFFGENPPLTPPPRRCHAVTSTKVSKHRRTIGGMSVKRRRLRGRCRSRRVVRHPSAFITPRLARARRPAALSPAKRRMRHSVGGYHLKPSSRITAARPGRHPRRGVRCGRGRRRRGRGRGFSGGAGGRGWRGRPGCGSSRRCG